VKKLACLWMVNIFEISLCTINITPVINTNPVFTFRQF
jgi:hypothetical protein